MMKRHCDHCDGLILPGTARDHRLTTIGNSRSVDVHVRVRKQGAEMDLCDGCLDVAARLFALSTSSVKAGE